MATLIIYIIKWAVVLTMLYSLYGIFMRRETLHSVNRVVLLFVLVASMVLPLVQIETREANIVAQGRERIEREIEVTLSPALQTLSPALPRNGEGVTLSPTLPHNGEGGRSADNLYDSNSAPLPIMGEGAGERVWLSVLVLIYIIGVVVFLLRYLISVVALLRLIRHGKPVNLRGIPQGVHVITHPLVTTPCSWMRWIILPAADTHSRPILEHELAHIRLGHSWDMLLCEFTCRVLWCVPFAWMLRQDLRDIHEYQADRSVLAVGINDEEYQLLLVKKASGTGLQPVVNALNQSPIKRRFTMMCQKPSRRRAALKAVYVVPLMGLALTAFARPRIVSEIEQQIEQQIEAAETAVVAEIKAVASSIADELPAVRRQEETEAAHPDSPDADAVEPTATAIEPADTAVKLADARLVQADLGASESKAIDNTPIPPQRAVEILDSVMLAVGAQKIADGTYLGHFQPSLNGDTVRLSQLRLLSKSSNEVSSVQYTLNEADPYAYSMTIQAPTRKDETGYYIRELKPTRATAVTYDQTATPQLRPADRLLSDINKLSNETRYMAIEQLPRETHLIIYWEIADKEYHLDDDVNNLAIIDVETGDRYMCRSVENFPDKRIKIDVTDRTGSVYQTCIVFPPLKKKVKRIFVGDADVSYDFSSFHGYNLKDLVRKPVRVIQ